MMQRIASVHLARWSIDLARRNVETSKRRNVEIAASLRDAGRSAHDSSSILLIQQTRGQQLIAHCCETASAAGVHPGMTLAHARALLPTDNIHIQPHRPERDRARLRALGKWAMRYSPIVAIDPSSEGDGLLIDIAGCERLFGGEDRLIRRMARDIRRLGFHANIAIASTLGCAWAVSRFSGSPTSIVLPGDERDAIAPLPVRGLRLDDETIQVLREVDLEWIGHILEIPRSQLVRRFGMEIITRIDQALGRAGECVQPMRYQPPLLVVRDFDGPTTQTEAIRIAMRELLEELCAMLRRRESGVGELIMKLLRVDAPPVEVAFTLAHPSRDVKHLWSLLMPKLESAQLGFGVDGLSLHALKTSHIAHKQVEMIETFTQADNEDAALGELIDSYISRLGASRVLCFDSAEAHIPEHRYLARPYIAPPRMSSRWHDRPGRANNAHGREAGATGVDINRPSILSRPQPITIANNDSGDPAHIQYHNDNRILITAIGPERITPEWWRSPDSLSSRAMARDYYRVQDDTGRWLWIYRELETNRWFFQGLWA